MSKSIDKISKASSSSKKQSTHTDTTNTEDFMSSVSNPDSNGRKFNSEINNLGIINMKSKNLNHHGAYLLCQRLKRDFSIIHSIDLSDNQLEDEGILYLSISLRLCTVLNTLNLSNNSITEYGVRVLLENLNYRYLKYLNLSGNKIGNKGIEHISKYLPNIQLQQLILNSVGIDEEGAKSIGFALMSSNWLKEIELSSNNVRLSGAVLLCRGLIGNNSLEEISVSYNNNFGHDGIVAMAECLKINKSLRIVDLASTKIGFEGAKALSQGLKSNSTLKSLNLSFNPVTASGIYEILKSINTETSSIEYLGLKNIPIQKHLILIIELIQQRRKFNCEYGNMVVYPDTINVKTSSDDESMIKLARFLGEKRMRLIDLFRVLDRGNKLEMDKIEFIRRMKLFEPRLTQKDLHSIAKNLSTKETIYYSTLFAQMTKQKPDNTYEINRKKAQLNEEEERFLNKFNRNETLKKLSSEPNSKTHSLKSTSNNESKFKEIDNWLESQNINSNISDFPDKDKQFKKNDLNTTKKLKLPIIMTTSADNLDKLEQNLVKTDQENDQKAKDSKSPAKLFVKKSRVSGRFSSQGDYKSKKSDVIKIKKSFENLHNDDSIETLKNRENLKAIDETYSNSFLTNQRKSINLESVEAGLL